MGPVGAPGRPVSTRWWTLSGRPLVTQLLQCWCGRKCHDTAGMLVVTLESVQTTQVILCIHFATIKDEE